MLANEELFWYQKSRTKLLEHGDRNTTYFYGVMAVRCRRKIISCLQDDNNNWIHDPDQLERLATNYYMNLFQDDGVYSPLNIRGAFPQLAEEDVHDLSRDVSMTELWSVVKSMGAFKAPGPDGFQAMFYHSQWELGAPSFSLP